MWPKITWWHVTKLVHEYFLAAELHGSKMELAQGTKQIKWTPPPSDWVRLNTNEASKNDLIVRCVGLLRGCTCEWLGGFTRYLNSCSAYINELCGVLETLKLEKEFEFRTIEHHIYSIVIVQNILEFV